MCDRAQVLQPGRELCLSLEEVDGTICFLFFFFFSSRRRHTRYWRDWSSDVCSSDLTHADSVELVMPRCRASRAGLIGTSSSRCERTAESRLESRSGVEAARTWRV